jgi:GNAT superfamily N-acetyltransferase
MNHVIDSKRIRKFGTPPGKEVSYELTVLEERRLTEIMDLQGLIVKELGDPELFHPGSIHFIRERIRKKGRIIGISSGNRLIACRIISFPGSDPDNLGIDLALPEDELHKVAHLEIFLVHPEYRGNALQLKTLPHAISILRDFGYEHLCTTVSPKNYPGVSNLLKGGFVIKELKEKYGGKLRYILYQNLAIAVSRVTEHTITLTNTDIEGQKRALAEGYYGYEARRRSGSIGIAYGR